MYVAPRAPRLRKAGRIATHDMAEAGAARVRGEWRVRELRRHAKIFSHALLLQVEGTHVTRSSTCSTAPMKNETRLRFV